MTEIPTTTLLEGEARFAGAAERMIQDQLIDRGIDDGRVLAAMRSIPRHLFVAEDLLARAYDDAALPTIDGQTISQPYMVALMTQELALKPGHRVLEIGTGSGYQAAILAMLAKEIVGVERHPDLAERAREQLHRLGLDNVRVEIGDGTLGWPDSAPFDRVMVTAAAPFIPSALVDQLAEDGRMVLPLGQRDIQRLVTLQRRGADLQRRDGIGCCFVPLVGEDGWQPAWP